MIMEEYDQLDVIELSIMDKGLGLNPDASDMEKKGFEVLHSSVYEEMIHNKYLEVEEVDSTPMKRRRKVVHHELKSVPPFKRFDGTKLVTCKTKYSQRYCSNRECENRKKVRTYCICTPGEMICLKCYENHILTCCNEHT